MRHDYDGAIAYLERLVALPIQAEPGLGLERTRLLLAQAGNPQDGFTTLHVTGSSGKGSTAAMAAAILRAAGYRVGLFTSPHLHDYTERIAVDGVPSARADWTRLLGGLQPLVDAMTANSLPGYTLGRPALLEVLWPLAALYFVERGVEVAVVEVGMGGRYDATNVNRARVGVITNVSLEHTQRLGATVAAIAYHKAGIAKEGGIVVTAARDPEALHAIATACAERQATLWRVTPEEGDGIVRYGSPHPTIPRRGNTSTPAAGRRGVPRVGGGDPRQWEGPPHGAGGAGGLRITTPLHTYDDLQLGLLGRHQQANAACAVAAVDALAMLGLLHVDAGAVRGGLAGVRVPGRLEWVADDPPTLLDGAHNPDAARALAAALDDLFPHARPVLLLGILGDKDIAAMVAALAPLASAVVVTEPPWQERAGRGADVAALAARYLDDVTFVPDVPVALARAQNLARARDAPLVVTGSLILVGAIRELLVVSSEL